MAFVIDIPGVITIALRNAGPAPALGPVASVMIPVGDWKIQTDGIVLMQSAGGAINPDLAEVLYPEMAEYVFRVKTPLAIRMQMANVGTSRVNFYPRATDTPNVQQIRSGTGDKC